MEGRPLVRKNEQDAPHSGEQIFHSSSHNSPITEAHGPGILEQVNIRSTTNHGQKAFASVARQIQIDKSASFDTAEVLLTTPLPTALHEIFRHPAPGMHPMFKGLPLIVENASNGKTKSAVIIDSSGEMSLDTPVSANFGGAGFVHLRRQLATTGIGAATTTAAVAGAATPGASGTASVGSAAAGGDAGTRGNDVKKSFAVVIVVGIAVFLAVLAAKKVTVREVAAQPSERRWSRQMQQGAKPTSPVKEASSGSGEDSHTLGSLTGVASMVKADSYSVHRKSLSRSFSAKSSLFSGKGSFPSQAFSEKDSNLSNAFSNNSSAAPSRGPSAPLFSVMESIQSEQRGAKVEKSQEAQSEQSGPEIDI